MEQKETVLCASSAYTRKFYLNEQFANLPESIKEELQIVCVMYTEDVGGVFEMVFTEEGELLLKTESEEDDFFYDEIGSVLKIKQIQSERRELLEALEMYYKVFFLGAKPQEKEGQEK